MRSSPLLPLKIPEVDLEKLIRKGKALREGSLATEPGISDSSHCPMLENPISTSHFPIRPLIGVSCLLNFGSVPVEFSPLGLGLEGDIFVTPISPDIVAWSRPYYLFPYPRLTIPPPLTIVDVVPTPTFVPSIPEAFSSNPLFFPFPPTR